MRYARTGRFYILMKAFLEGPALPVTPAEYYGNLADHVQQVTEYQMDCTPVDGADRALQDEKRAQAAASFWIIHGATSAEPTESHALIAYADAFGSAPLESRPSDTYIARTRYMFTRQAMMHDPRLSRTAFAEAATEHARRLVDSENYTRSINEIDEATDLLDTTVLADQEKSAYGMLQIYKALAIARTGNADSALALALSVEQHRDTVEVIEVAARASRFDVIDEILRESVGKASEYAQDPDERQKDALSGQLLQIVRMASELGNSELDEAFSRQLQDAVEANVLTTEEYCQIVFSSLAYSTPRQGENLLATIDQLSTTKGLDAQNQTNLWHAILELANRFELPTNMLDGFIDRAKKLAGKSPYAVLYQHLLTDADITEMAMNASAAFSALPAELQDNNWFWSLLAPAIHRQQK